MAGLDCAYVAQFGRHSSWNALHDANEWRPLTNDEVEASEKVERSHFTAFFSAVHSTRHQLLPQHSVRQILRIVRDCLDRWKTNWVWLHLRRALRSRVILQRHVCVLRNKVSDHRTEMLDGWLTYWRDAEAKAHEELQARQRPNKLGGCMTAERASQLAMAQVMTSTCEQVKVKVLWELYWLLHAQTSIKKRTYWTRWRSLLRLRHCLRQISCSPCVVETYVKPALDFWDNEPLSVRAVDAALFVMALQVPRFQYRAGEEVTLKELVRLANAPQLVFPCEGDVRLRHASGVVTAFMDSPLCSEAAWLCKRFAMPMPLIPRRTWRVEVASSRRSSVSSCSDVLTDESDDQLLRLLEERTSPGQARRNGRNCAAPQGLASRKGSCLSRQSSFSSRRTSNGRLLSARSSCSGTSKPGTPFHRSFPDLPSACPPQSPASSRPGSSMLPRASSKSQLRSTLTPRISTATTLPIGAAKLTPRIGAAAPLTALKESGLRQLLGFMSHSSPPQGGLAAPKMFSLPPLRN